MTPSGTSAKPSLFASPSRELLALVRHVPGFFSPRESDRLESRLRAELPWQQRSLRMMGKEVLEPRLTAWLGDPGTVYTYSGLRLAPAPWGGAALEVKRAVERELGARFNSVLANLYRDGQDSVGWHSDDEPELGPAPLIASVSFGGPRRFVMRDRKSGQRFEWQLGHGALFVMGPGVQKSHVHTVPKTRRPVGPRINYSWPASVGCNPSISEVAAGGKGRWCPWTKRLCRGRRPRPAPFSGTQNGNFASISRGSAGVLRFLCHSRERLFKDEFGRP
jgi:alkylated DNA repair dioxygenase AlkB